MPVYKDDSNGTFFVQCYYRDARGSKRHKTKRGFSSEVEAAVWESQFKSLNGGAMDMTFSEFVEVYASEVRPRLVMVAFELLPSRGSLVRLFVRGSQGGRRCLHFFPPLDSM